MIFKVYTHIIYYLYVKIFNILRTVYERIFFKKSLNIFVSYKYIKKYESYNFIYFL